MSPCCSEDGEERPKYSVIFKPDEEVKIVERLEEKKPAPAKHSLFDRRRKKGPSR